MGSLIELSNVSLIYQTGWLRRKAGAQAVAGVSLSVGEGEISALVGESGCGKTSVGKLALGLIRPTSGRVLYMGKDIWGRDGKHLRPTGQIVHQDSYAALNPVRTVYQTLAAPLRRYGVARNKVREEARKLLEFVGIMPPDYFLDKYPHHMSGGMRQRLLFARAIIPKPKFIVADEPVAMIDASLRISVLDLMLKLKEELGIAFLYISHDLATTRYFAKNGKLAVMYLGKVAEEGPMEELLRQPLHPYLQALLSAAPVPDPRIARERKLMPLKETEPPSAASPPPGCRFHPRCPYAKEPCTQEVPPLVERGSGHRVACHLVDSIPPWRLI